MRRPLIKQMIVEFQDYTPNLPKGFEGWARREIRKRNHMMFYKKDKKRTVAVCSACGTVQNPKKIGHNEEITCSKCRKKAVAKSINKATRYTVRDFFTIAQKFKSKDNAGIIVRYFALTMKYKESREETQYFPEVIPDKLTNPIYGELWEASRTYIVKNAGKWATFDAEKEIEYEWIKGKDGGLIGHALKEKWVIERKRSSMFNKELLRAKDCIVYKRNLKGIQSGDFKYSGITHFKLDRFNIADYLWTYKELPELELLSKLGFYNLASDVIHKNIYWGLTYMANDVIKKLRGYDKNTTSLIKKNNWGVHDINEFDELKKLGRMTLNNIEWIANNLKGNKDRLYEVMKYAPIDKVIKFINKQSEEKHDAIATWADYIYQCKLLNLNLEDEYHLYPKNLEERHLMYAAQIKVRKSALVSKKIKEQHKKWSKKLDWHYMEYDFLVARTGGTAC